MYKKLGISSNYKVRSIKSSDWGWINSLCEGVFSGHKLYMSEVFVDSYPCHIQVKCLLFVPRSIYTMKEVRKRLPVIISLLKSMISIKSNKNVSFKVGIMPSVFGSSRVLSSYLKRRITWNPFKFTMSVSKVFKRIGVLRSPYSYVSNRNKFKNRR